MRFLIGFILMLLPNLLCAQDAQDIQARRSRYMERAEVHHLANTATITANSPRPLAQATTALSEEYAWVIDFEDPPYYSKYDLVDDTAPEWRAAHPTDKGVTAISGNGFQSEFPKNHSADNATTEQEDTLNKVVTDYNESGNPGKFSVRNEGNGRFAVVGMSVKDEDGQDKAVTPILDTPITIQTDSRDALTTIQAILNALSLKTKTEVVPGNVPLNALARTQVKVGGENVPARVLLLQTLSGINVKFYWLLYYDADAKAYFFNVLPLMKASYDESGNRTTVLVQ